jgi:MFS family permease
MNLGYTKLTANALTSVGGYLSLGLAVLVGYTSDHFNKRGLLVIIPLTWTMILLSLVVSGAVVPLWNKYALFTLLNAGIAIFHPTNGAWLSINARGPQERSISLAYFYVIDETNF